MAEAVTGDGLRAPGTRWEYAVSAADQLLLWHGRTVAGLVEHPLRVRAVVLLGACIADRAEGAGLDGPAVAEVVLADVVRAVDHFAVSAMESCRTVPEDVGGEVVEELLRDYGTPGFEAVRQVVREALVCHISDSGPHARIVDRRQALLAVRP
ncbi:hypothetical protein ACIQZB_43475 [Streptomyces sp. NPDC097727]|uniref:hypothetical protein n=1 Tax=Streptomyces sp. NPDC097727 TaxID=3366092 RepID=UPI0037FAC734